jgi:hypothetical protein
MERGQHGAVRWGEDGAGRGSVLVKGGHADNTTRETTKTNRRVARRSNQPGTRAAYFNRYVLCGLVADLSDTTDGAGLEPFTTPTVAAAFRFAPDNQHAIVTFDLSGMSVWLAETEGAGGGLHNFHLSRDGLRIAAISLDRLES